jgi:hypothetical protein
VVDSAGDDGFDDPRDFRNETAEMKLSFGGLAGILA